MERFYRLWFYGGTWLQIGLILAGGHLKYSLLLFACWLSVVLFILLSKGKSNAEETK